MNQGLKFVAKIALWLEFIFIIIYGLYIPPDWISELIGPIHISIKIIFFILWVVLSPVPIKEGDEICALLAFWIAFTIPIIVNEILYATNSTDVLTDYSFPMVILTIFFFVLAGFKWLSEHSALFEKKYAAVREESSTPVFKKLRY